MIFKTQFEDGDIIDQPWSPDILCEAYYTFCPSKPHLYHLTLDTKMAKRFQSQKRKEDITLVQPGDSVFIDLRFFGDEWYESLNLADASTTSYVFRFTYTHWYHKNSKRKISGQVELDPSIKYALDGYAVFCWGETKIFNPNIMVLVDEHLILCEQHRPTTS